MNISNMFSNKDNLSTRAQLDLHTLTTHMEFTDFLKHLGLLGFSSEQRTHRSTDSAALEPAERVSFCAAKCAAQYAAQHSAQRQSQRPAVCSAEHAAELGSFGTAQCAAYEWS